jgi:hypothetical protein
MEKEFIPYEQSLALKELGFDEPCFMQWTYAPELIFCIGNWGNTKFKTNKESYSDSAGDCISAPLYQQAFRWFREKYGYLPNIHDFNGNFKATLSGNCNWLGSWTKTYEEAELACLIKLIEIVKKYE